MQTSFKRVPPKAPLRVLVADGSPATCDDLCAAISEDGAIEIVARVHKTIAALTRCEELRPAVVILDLQLPGQALASVLPLIKRIPPSPVIIVLSPYTSRVLRERCLRAGADYVFTKSADVSRIAQTLQELQASVQSPPEA